MEIPIDHIEIVESFLRSEISEKEAITRISLGSSPEEFYQLIEDYKTSVRLAELSTLKEQLVSIHSEEIKGKRHNIIRPLVAFAIAASLIILAIISGIFSSSEAEFDDYYAPYPNRLTLRGSQKGSYEEAIKLYNQGNHQEAALQFSKTAPQDHDYDFYFFRANNALALNDFQQAIEDLEKIGTSTKNSYYQQTRWYLSLALWQSGNTAKALQFLGQIEEGDYKYKEAKQLKSQLSKK